jgi:hypothetical protein
MLCLKDSFFPLTVEIPKLSHFLKHLLGIKDMLVAAISSSGLRNNVFTGTNLKL